MSSVQVGPTLPSELGSATERRSRVRFRREVFGVPVSETTYGEAVEVAMGLAGAGAGGCVAALPVHGLMTAVTDPAYGAAIREFDLVCPDGQPVRFALNLLCGSQLEDRVYGPELMLRLCDEASRSGVPVYLYGSYPHVVSDLAANLRRRFPKLMITGAEEGVYRPLTLEEETSLIDRVNDSGAGILFLGLGLPRQELFAVRYRDRIRAVQVCVGAAFDFHAGTKSMAPRWMQRSGLEWLFRLSREPRRLGRRYLVTNTQYLLHLTSALFQRALGKGTRYARRGPE